LSTLLANTVDFWVFLAKHPLFKKDELETNKVVKDDKLAIEGGNGPLKLFEEISLTFRRKGYNLLRVFKNYIKINPEWRKKYLTN
jgi:hypothetical protein